MKIGILGGSFDPIHKGHLTLARESQKQLQLEKILFLPALHPPHKSQTKQMPAASGADRTRMVELAIGGEPGWELCDLELRRSGISYTVETLRELKQIYLPPHELFFIAGADSFRDLPNWKDPGEILKLCEWIVAPRPGFPLPEKLPPRFHQLQMSPLEISASGLRRELEKEKGFTDWIPSQVKPYIEEKKLYRRTG